MQILKALDFTIKLDLAAVNTMSELVRNRAATYLFNSNLKAK